MRRLAWTSLCAVLSCNGGTDIGNPVADLELALHGEAAGVSIQEAWVAVDAVTLHAPADCAAAPVLSVPGPLAIDLVSGDPPAPLRQLALEGGTYCRLALVWGQGAAGDPADLVGASVAIRGTRADGTPFVLRSARAGEIGYGGATANFSIPDGTTTLFIGFDAVSLFATVDLDAATVGGDGVIHVEAGANDTQLAAFDAALHGSSHLFDDADHDGVLDPTEHDAAHAIATGH
jgi:hypothetical protein